MNIYYTALAAVIGSFLSGILGWLDSVPVTPFSFRQFLGTVIRAIISGVGTTLIFIAEPNITVPVGYFIAFGLGVAGDAGGKRLNSVYNNFKP